jgi:hypothetical protein
MPASSMFHTKWEALNWLQSSSHGDCCVYIKFSRGLPCPPYLPYHMYTFDFDGSTLEQMVQ